MREEGVLRCVLIGFVKEGESEEHQDELGIEKEWKDVDKMLAERCVVVCINVDDLDEMSVF